MKSFVTALMSPGEVQPQVWSGRWLYTANRSPANCLRVPRCFSAVLHKLFSASFKVSVRTYNSQTVFAKCRTFVACVQCIDAAYCFRCRT